MIAPPMCAAAAWAASGELEAPDAEEQADRPRFRRRRLPLEQTPNRITGETRPSSPATLDR